MAWIEVIDESEATGDLSEIYDSIIAARGKMSNIMRIHSLAPPTMQAHMDLYLKIMFGRSSLKRADRELIATVVSSTNECPYCVHHHAEALNHYWKNNDRIRRLIADYSDADLTERQLAMAGFAVDLTRAPGGASEEKVAKLREAGLTDEEVLTVTMITSYFNFVNRIALGLGVEFSAAEVSGYKY